MSSPIDKVVLQLRAVQNFASQGIYSVISAWAVDTANAIKSSLASGALGVQSRSGNLSRAVTQRVSNDGDVTTAQIGVFGGVPYASAIEGGAVPHRIDPVSAKVLAFKPAGGSRYVFARFVNHPGNPAYGFVSKPAADMLPSLTSRLATIGATARGS